MKRVRIKICGMTRAEDAQLASDLGTDAVGLIFYPKSPRTANISDAAKIIASIAPFCKSVAVVVNPTVELVEKILNAAPFDMLQFHGNEEPKFCEQFGMPYVKALRMSDEVDVQNEADKYSSASGVLLDTYVPGVVGGTGETFDWSRTKPINAHRLILAGGLDQQTLSQAVHESGVTSLDLASSVERVPGIKDQQKLRAVFDALNAINCAEAQIK